MKNRCEFCGTDLSHQVQMAMSSSDVGKLSCPHCHKQNKRYISTYDLETYNLGVMALYGIVLLLPSLATAGPLRGYFSLWVMVAMMACLIFLIIYAMGAWARYVYAKAPGKAEWAHYTVKEDALAAEKAVRRYFIIFVFTAMAFGILSMTYNNYLYYLAAVAAFIAFFLWQHHRTHDKELAYYQATFRAPGKK